ncbi:MAG: THUMP domain-containing protein [Betaproteobacteria bacterium]|nr:THUMP domain-containing protein [Betaproteobacteria bacterium]
MPGTPLQRFFAPCPRGLEAALAQELETLGALGARAVPGGVGFEGPFSLCYAANLESRLASRILWHVGQARYHGENDVYDAVRRLPWPELFDVRRTLMVKVSAHDCPLRSLDFITLRIKDAVCDAFRAKHGERPSVDTRAPDVRVQAFFERARFDVYVDTSGPPLFQRGLRVQSGTAPLRENLAAGILKLAGWEPGVPLFDPMCGTGTFLLEAAQMAVGQAAGLNRRFGFEKLANFDEGLWSRLREAARARQKPFAPQPIFGGDRYGDALQGAAENLRRAGLEGVVSLKQGNVLEANPPSESGVLVTNPPYGVRLGDQEELAAFYPRLGDHLKQRFAGWRVYLFTADLRLPKLIRLSPSRRVPLFNGPLECRLYEFKLVHGPMRKRAAPDTAPPPP